MKPKYLELTPELYDYACRHRTYATDALLDELRSATEQLGEVSGMLISREQGSFMSLLVAATGAKSAVEVGTFTGYSSICIARGLGSDGRLLCIDINPDWTAIARRFWAKAGLADSIDLRLGGGLAELEQLPSGELFDFAFIDADKAGYDAYFELLLPHMKPNSLMIFDNMLRHGAVLDRSPDPETAAICRLNEKLAMDPRIECVLLPVADGLQICRVLPSSG